MDVKKLKRVSAIADERGIKVETVRAAIREGRIFSWETACGLKLTTDDAVDAWLRTWGGDDRPGKPRSFDTKAALRRRPKE